MEVVVELSRLLVAPFLKGLFDVLNNHLPQFIFFKLAHKVLVIFIGLPHVFAKFLFASCLFKIAGKILGILFSHDIKCGLFFICGKGVFFVLANDYFAFPVVIKRAVFSPKVLPKLNKFFDQSFLLLIWVQIFNRRIVNSLRRALF